MKSYSITYSAPIPNGRPGATLKRSYEKYQTVRLQTVSPRVNGKLVLRSNPLQYERMLRELKVGSTWSFRNQYANPDEINPWIYNEDNLRSMFRSEIISTTNRWVLKAQGFGTNLIDIYRTRIETMNMVTSTIRRLTSTYRSIRKRKFRDACEIMGISYRKPSRKNRNNPPGAWLEYTYGWSPLISDMYLVLNQPFPDLQIRVATGTEAVRTKRTDNGIAVATVIDEEVKMRMRVVGYLRVKNSALKAISYYGVDNPTLAVWEAMPYSFVVDWFLPIGDYLSSLSAFNGIEVLNPSTSISWDCKWRGYTYVKDAKKVYGGLRSHVPAQLTQSYTVFRRSTSRPTYKFPLPENGFSLNRFASALSLMAKAFERKF